MDGVTSGDADRAELRSRLLEDRAFYTNKARRLTTTSKVWGVSSALTVVIIVVALFDNGTAVQFSVLGTFAVFCVIIAVVYSKRAKDNRRKLDQCRVQWYEAGFNL